MNLILTSPDECITTAATASAKALRFLQEPDSHLEAEIIRSQRTNRTDIRRI